MRIERTLIDLSRLEALNLAEPLSEFGLGQIDCGGLVVAPSDEGLPTAVASDESVIGCVVGHREGGASTLIALTFDGKSIGHYELPAVEAGSLEPTEAESSLT